MQLIISVVHLCLMLMVASEQTLWKGFDFSIDFGYHQLGGQVYDGSYAAAMNHNRGGAMHVDLYKAWSP